jgi:hypothetical protein
MLFSDNLIIKLTFFTQKAIDVKDENIASYKLLSFFSFR